MPIHPFPASYELRPSALATMLTRAGLQKEWDETISSFEALLIWKDWFRAQYGELREIRSRSNPDDPPDIEFVFDQGQVALEHTFFKPHPNGKEFFSALLCPGTPVEAIRDGRKTALRRPGYL